MSLIPARARTRLFGGWWRPSSALGSRWQAGLNARVCAVLLLLLCAAEAHAEQRSEAGRSGASLVLVIDYVGVDDAELPVAARELLGRIEVRVASRFEAVAGEVLAYARIEADGSVVEVVLEDPHTHAPRAQRSVPRAESPALLRETVAHVLLGLVEPLAEAARNPAVAEPLPSAVAAAPAPDAISSTAIGAGLGLAGGPVLIAARHWAVRIVASAALAFGSRLSPQLALDLGSTLPTTLRERDVSARFLVPGARLRARITPLESKRAALDTSFSVGADLMVLKPTSADASIETSSRSLRLQPVFGAAISGRARLSGQLALVFGVGTDVDPLPRAWLVDVDQTKTTLLRSAVFRPYAMLGLDWSSLPVERGEAP